MKASVIERCSAATYAADRATLEMRTSSTSPSKASLVPPMTRSASVFATPRPSSLVFESTGAPLTKSVAECVPLS
jgi:hypothetical protein